MGKVTCGECKKSCKGQAVRLTDKYFHVKCFKCKECRKQLAAGGFYTKDDKFYCAEDYQRLFGTKCAECGKFVEGEVVTALGNTYHQHCFHCTKCRNKFAAGDKVTYTGQDYMCTPCLEKYERSLDAAAKKSGSPTKKSPTKRESPHELPERPVSAEQIVPVQATRQHASLVTSTPAKPQRSEGNLASPTSENSHVSESGAYYQNGALSPISLSSDDSFSPRRYASSTGDICEDPELNFLGPSGDRGKSLEDPNDDVFTFDTTGDSGLYSPGLLPSPGLLDPSSQQKDRLSPIQQIMMYRSHSPASTLSRSSRKSPESTGSYERKYDMEFGRFYNQSYLKPAPKPYMKGPSINPTEKPRSPHFHRPENFSYTQVRRDYIRPMKKGDSETMQKRKIEPVVPMNNEEPIKLSKIPDAQQEEQKLLPIERDDWPSPPAPAAAYPELLRNQSLHRGKSQEKLEKAEEPSVPDPRIQRNIEELSKIRDSGVGKGIMKGLEKKRDTSPTLDPRSASRTPSAKIEPPYKTRYESPVFASPSRDLDFRPRLHSMDDEIVKYRNTTLPASNLPVDHRRRFDLPTGSMTLNIQAPRPGYGLAAKSATLPARARSYDPYEQYNDHNKENGDPMETRSHHTSRSSVEEEYDPETGLRRSRWRSSGNFSGNTSSYMHFRRSMPSMLKGDGPPLLYPYEQLLVTNCQLPPGVERNTIEMHLSKDEFESIFHMRRDEFYRIAEWKRNDLKKRVGLF